MSGQTLEQSDQTYIRPSALAKILGWSRPNVYYWLNKCQVDLVEYAGYKMVPVQDLPVLIMTLRAAKEAARNKGEAADG